MALYKLEFIVDTPQFLVEVSHIEFEHLSNGTGADTRSQTNRSADSQDLHTRCPLFFLYFLTYVVHKEISVVVKKSISRL
jgi:hypothetical protein